MCVAGRRLGRLRRMTGTIRGAAHIAGAFEHPLRTIPDRTTPQIHAEVAVGALADAGLTMGDVDAYFCAGDAPGFGPLSMAEYLGLDHLSYVDSTEIGGSSYVAHVGHAAAAIAAGKCSVALITLAGKPRTGGSGPGGSGRVGDSPEFSFEVPYGTSVLTNYALAATRHMHEFGTTSAQLAEIKVAASTHAQHNPNAFLRDVVTVEEVLESPMVCDPLHRLDSCVITDGGGALVVVSSEVARTLARTSPVVLGHGEAPKHTSNGRIDLTHTGALWSGPRAFEEAGVTPASSNARGPDHTAPVYVRSMRPPAVCLRASPWPSTFTARRSRSRAISGRTTTMAPPPSVLNGRRPCGACSPPSDTKRPPSPLAQNPRSSMVCRTVMVKLS